MNIGDIMEIPTHYQKFYDFLVSHDALENFLHNKHTSPNIEYRRPIDGFLYWANTPQGHSYWSVLDSKFLSDYPIRLPEFLRYIEILQQSQPYEYW